MRTEFPREFLVPGTFLSSFGVMLLKKILLIHHLVVRQLNLIRFTVEVDCSAFSKSS